MVEIAYTLTEAFAHLPKGKTPNKLVTFNDFLDRALEGSLALSVELGGDVMAVPADAELSVIKNWGEPLLIPLKLKRGQILSVPLPLHGRALGMLLKICKEAGMRVQVGDDPTQARKAYVLIDKTKYLLVSPEIYTPKVMSNLENAALIARASRAHTGRYLEADFPTNSKLVMTENAVAQGVKSNSEIRALYCMNLHKQGNDKFTTVTANHFGVGVRQVRKDVEAYKALQAGIDASAIGTKT